LGLVLRVAFASHDPLPCRAPLLLPGLVHGSGGRPRRRAFTRSAPGWEWDRLRLVHAVIEEWEMDPTIHQIIFPRIIMLARKVAADLCLPCQSLPCIFMCTICSLAFASHRMCLRQKLDNAEGRMICSAQSLLATGS